MTEQENKLLAVFEVRLLDLLSLCKRQQQKIEELTAHIKTEKESLQQVKQNNQSLNAKYSELLTAHILSSEEGEVKSARMRLNKVVREVEKCIALLNG
jgi:translation initiation factor 2B subunit (eIF-2B alpha/beta/delta family)